jgi:hypothetical protein
LKDAEKLASQADVELARLQQLKQSRKQGSERGSSILVDSGATMTMDRLLAKLEAIKLQAKDKVSRR